ncbi:MAG: metallophosphoesterase [Bacteroidales bacterium]|nr:metallophosphoesterase [Bacteroidales bacterium]
MIYGFVLGNKQIRISKIELEYQSLPNEFNDYKIVQLSDIHLGNSQKMKSILEKTAICIEKIKPDLILFTGDLVNNFASETEGWENTIRKITLLAESYSILGNHDYGDYTYWENNDAKTENLNKIILSHQKFGFQILKNQNKVIKLGNDSIFLVGVENWGHSPFPQYADFEKASEGIPENAFTILMSHDPAYWESQIKWGKSVDLTLSGHTHGAQWGINIAGIPFSMAYLMGKNWGGIYRYGNSFLNVNTGLGMVGTLLRIDMPAEISVITLKRGKVNGV